MCANMKILIYWKQWVVQADFNPFIMKSILKCCQDSWDQQIDNKLHEIHFLCGKNP